MAEDGPAITEDLCNTGLVMRSQSLVLTQGVFQLPRQL